jgi:hypothetical protein
MDSAPWRKLYVLCGRARAIACRFLICLNWKRHNICVHIHLDFCSASCGSRQECCFEPRFTEQITMWCLCTSVIRWSSMTGSSHIAPRSLNYSWQVHHNYPRPIGWVRAACPCTTAMIAGVHTCCCTAGSWTCQIEYNKPLLPRGDILHRGSNSGARTWSRTNDVSVPKRAAHHCHQGGKGLLGHPLRQHRHGLPDVLCFLSRAVAGWGASNLWHSGGLARGGQRLGGVDGKILST